MDAFISGIRRKLIIVARGLIDSVDRLRKIFQACQKLIDGHPVFVIEVGGGRKVFPEAVIDKPILMSVEMPDPQQPQENG